jgi:TPR repeat protein
MNLAGCYLRGEGVEKSSEQAVAWLMRAAKRGDAGARYRLSILCQKGNGLAQDKARAFDLCMQVSVVLDWFGRKEKKIQRKT